MKKILILALVFSLFCYMPSFAGNDNITANQLENLKSKVVQGYKVKPLDNITVKQLDNLKAKKIAQEHKDNITAKQLNSLQSKTTQNNLKSLIKENNKILGDYFPDTVIKKITISGNKVSVYYSGNLKYNIFNQKELMVSDTYALDIINPKQVYDYPYRKLTPDSAGLISSVILAWHKQPKDLYLYHKPFFRISIHSGSSHYTITNKNNILSVIFTASKPVYSVHNRHLASADKVYSGSYRIPPPPRYTPPTSKTPKILPDAFAKPDIITKIVVSNTDVNRIVSPEDIKDIVYSKEKGVMVHYVGKNAFVKFVIKRNPDGSFEYITSPAELYIVTPNAVYTIIIVPKDVSGRTIRLAGNSLVKIKENERMFTQLPYEKKITTIIKDVYKNKIPYTWDVKHPSKPKPIKIKNDLSAILLTSIKIEGTGFRVNEYEISSDTPLRITETDFLNTKIAVSPIAIALTRFSISKDNPAYLFVVSRKGGDNGR